MKTIFLTFADSRMQKSLNRIHNQAADMRAYDNILCADENWLDRNFVDRHKKYLKPGVRGFGYWCWKPQIVKQILENMAIGDVLQYTDAGCHLNPMGRARLIEYFELVNNSPIGVLGFQAPN